MKLNAVNQLASRAVELDELYTKIQTVTGFTVERLLEMFLAGYTMEPPDYSASVNELRALAVDRHRTTR